MVKFRLKTALLATGFGTALVLAGVAAAQDAPVSSPPPVGSSADNRPSAQPSTNTGTNRPSRGTTEQGSASSSQSGTNVGGALPNQGDVNGQPGMSNDARIPGPGDMSGPADMNGDPKIGQNAKSGVDYSRCSASVTDHCMQGGGTSTRGKRMRNRPRM